MNTFGEKLNQLRIQRKLTGNQLAALARVPASLISGLQHNDRTIGENNARKIGVALALNDQELEDFVYLAINNATDKVLFAHREYQAEVLNLLADRLLSIGYPPEKIDRCIYRPKFKDAEADAALILADGKTALIDLKITYR